MKITLKEISIKDVFKGYRDSQIEGVVGYNGKLDIRPKYQREFVYGEVQRNSVINTVSNGFPLNVMYWIKNPGDNYELLDGQQRTLSICQYLNNEFSIKYRYFNNLTDTEKKAIEDYKLMIYICEGTDKEKLEWFKTINIAGERLTNQELRNAVYTGEWLADAKKYFSKNGCAAYSIAHKYIKGTAIRQEYLETAIRWIASKNNESIEEYMAKHQHDKDANPLWVHFQKVINWITTTFPKYRREMASVEWGILYNKYKDCEFNTDVLERDIQRFMLDDDVTKKSGIYEYLLSKDEKYLNIRGFTPKMKSEAYERQKGVCPICKNSFSQDEMEADHIDPWHSGGKTNSDNCQMLCRPCNRRKSGK